MQEGGSPGCRCCLLSKAELLCQKQQVPPARGLPTCPPRATLHKRLREATAQVAAHWSDLDKELTVGFYFLLAQGCPGGVCLMGHRLCCCPGEEEVLNLLAPVAHQVISTALAMLFHLSAPFKASHLWWTSNCFWDTGTASKLCL